MKTILLITLLVIPIYLFGQTQHEMHKQANENYIKADKELNEVYQNLLKEYESDTVFINSLKKAQRIWISFRDAELEMKFPGENKQLLYGSIYPICVLNFLKEFTEERTEKLNIWLYGIKEGDMCLGSTKTN